MHHGEGHDVEVAYLEWLVGEYLVKVDGGNARIFVFSEAVGHVVAYVAGRYFVGIDFDVAKMAVGSKVVHAAYVVVVVVSDEQAVDFAEWLG